MATLRIMGCRVDTQSITVSFSEPVDQTAYPGTTTPPDASSALNPNNYTIFAPNSGFNHVPLTSPPWTAYVLPDGQTVVWSTAKPGFNPGDWVQINVNNIGAAGTTNTPVITVAEQTSGRVPSEAVRATRDVEDAISYPLLTEEVSYRPSSPVGTPTGGGGGSYGGGGGGQSLSMVAARAVSDVLGWKPSSTDPTGFVGALTQSFNLTEVEGHVESTWVPRTFAVQTDLGGGISGAQASLYTRAKDALDQSLSLLDGLYPLDPDADPEYVKALREMARSQMTEIVRELGAVGLPSILRIDTYFDILLGQHPTRHFTHVEFNPDKIKGTLGELRDTYGIYFRGNPWNNTVKDEEDITNFRVISDYMTSLLQSWIANREFFVVAPNQIAFFGTQLVLISRQLNVVAETVNELRFTLDSVFIGPNERQTLLLEFRDRSLPAMFLEDMLVEIEKFVGDEGPRLLRDGGKISVTNNILPVVRSLRHLVEQARDPDNKKKVPDGFRTARVRRSLDDLHDQLRELIRLTEQVEQQLPVPEYALTIESVLIPPDTGIPPTITILGSGFDPMAEVFIQSPSSFPASAYQTEFYSAERIDVNFTSTSELSVGYHDITVRNPGPDGESATLRNAFHWDNNRLTSSSEPGDGAGYSADTTSNQKVRAVANLDATATGAGGGGGTATSSPSATPTAESVVTSQTAQEVPRPPTATAAAQTPTAVSAAIAAPAAAGVPAPPQTSAAGADVGPLQTQVAQLHEAHNSFADEVREKFDKLFGLVEGKSKK